METIQQNVMGVLLDILLDRGLVSKSVHNKAVNLVNSSIDFPAFFEYPVCCQKEVTESEFTSNSTGASAR